MSSSRIAHTRTGTGEPLVLLHGTNCTHHIWDPLLPALVAERDVVAIDLPAHGGSPPTSFDPPGFAAEIAMLLDELGLTAPAVVGHSVGGWTALELAKLGRAGAVLALAPAGLWRRRSPALTDARLALDWGLGRLLGGLAAGPLRTRGGRAVGLRSISVRPGDVPSDVAVQTARDAAASVHFPAHFRATRRLRFTDGAAISADVPVRVVWAEEDRVALRGRSRFPDELPSHARVEAWPECGHMVMWDRPGSTVTAALATTVPGR